MEKNNVIPLHDDQSDIRAIQKKALATETKLWIDTSYDFIYKDRVDIKWKRPKEIQSSPIFLDAKNEGGCRFDPRDIQAENLQCESTLKFNLAALSALTLNSSVFKFVVPSGENSEFNTQNYAGAFVFRLWRFGQFYEVIVDDRLPVRNGKVHSFLKEESIKEFWPVLLEKAYNKLFGFADSFSKTSAPDLLVDISGGIPETDVALGRARPSLASLEIVLQEATESNCLIVFGKPKQSEDNDTAMNYNYCITKFISIDSESSEKVFLLRIFMPFIADTSNAWKGSWSEESDEWKAISKEKKKEIGDLKVGEFLMPLSEFMIRVWDLYIVHLDPQFLHGGAGPSSKSEDTQDKKYLLFEKGKWVTGVSSGGNRLQNAGKTFHRNPQFLLTFEPPKDAKEGAKDAKEDAKDAKEDAKEDAKDAKEDATPTDCTVIVSVLQKSIKSKQIPIDLYFYNLKQKTDDQLDKYFFLHNLPMAEKYSQSKREVSTRVKIYPGEYCIVAASDETTQEAQFYLRVLFEPGNNITLKALKEKVAQRDTDVRVSLIPTLEQEKNRQADENIHAFFNEVAGEEGVVGLSGLKKVLDYCMQHEQPRSDSYKVRTSIISYIFPYRTVFATMEEYEFSRDLTRSLLAMADTDHSGKLSIIEFQRLWSQVRQWIQIYEMNSDENGFLQKKNLRKALNSAGFQLSGDILSSLAVRYSDRNNIIPFDDFVKCASKLRTVFDYYTFKDPEHDDQAKFEIEDLLVNTIYS